MRWALVAHPDQFIHGQLVNMPRNIPEDSVPVATAQGWVVLGQDTGIYDDRVLKALEPPAMDMDLLSNPRRSNADTGED